MFNCQIGNHLVGVGNSVVKVVTQTRPKNYENKIKVRMGERFVDKFVSSSGWEIVKEINSCAACAPKEQPNE